MDLQVLNQCEITIEQCIDTYKHNKVMNNVNNVKITCSVCGERIKNFILSEYAKSNEIMCKKDCVNKLKKLLMECENQKIFAKVPLIREIYNISLTNMHVWINFNHYSFLGTAICKAFEINNDPNQSIEVQNLKTYLNKWIDIVAEILPRGTVLKSIELVIRDSSLNYYRKQIMDYFDITQIHHQ